MTWAFLYLFAIFSSYYVHPPDSAMRPAWRVASSNLSWLFTGTLLAMMAVNPVFAALRPAGCRACGLSPLRTVSSSLNLLVFLLLFWFPSCGRQYLDRPRIFHLTSVFNLFVVSVFWAFMVDIFTSEQGSACSASIAAAATFGGIGDPPSQRAQ